jgi:hypothetical protein
MDPCVNAIARFFWQRKKADEPRIRSVGFAVKNSLLSTIEPLIGETERLLTQRMATSAGFVKFMCAYAPTLSSTAEEKGQFYDALDSLVGTIPNKEALFITEDLNARTGAGSKVRPSGTGR